MSKIYSGIRSCTHTSTGELSILISLHWEQTFCVANHTNLMLTSKDQMMKKPKIASQLSTFFASLVTDQELHHQASGKTRRAK
jgi:hypothetical protein